jgi:hypothetical protein
MRANSPPFEGFEDFDISKILSPEVSEIESEKFNGSLIYKYYSSDRRHVLESPQVRFTQKTALNDPFELSKRWHELASPQTRDYIGNWLKSQVHNFFNEPARLQEKVISEAKGAYPLLPEEEIIRKFNSDEARAFIEKMLLEFDARIERILDFFASDKDAFDSIIEEIVSGYGILSLTETPCNQAMWGLYASAGHGFVVAFDASHDFLNTTINLFCVELSTMMGKYRSFWKTHISYFLLKIHHGRLSKNGE